MKSLLIIMMVAVMMGMTTSVDATKPICPHSFEYSTEWVFTPEFDPDKNNNGAVCVKELPNGKFIFKDDFR